MSPARDTIFALSSGRPPAAIAVVRVSGPDARRALETLGGRLPAPRHASLARLRDPQNGEPLDEALALWLPGPRSETGEDMTELHLHGGRAVIAAVLAALGLLPGFRPAEAGEFTRRAFENGRLDLTAVEGLADLINAETEAQRRQAYRQMKGLLGDKAESWRSQIIQALALVEAGIDFSDEDDVPDDVMRPALDIARKLHDEISEVLAQAGRGERLRDGMVVAIAGPPNAGKSTLLNRIARREAAIVSPYAGTTRDVIEVHLDLGGYPVTLLDTAGVRETEDPVEQEGVRRARQRAAEADLVLWVTDAREPVGDGLGQWPNLAGAVAEATGSVAEKSRPVAELGGSLDQASGGIAEVDVNRGGSSRRPRPLADISDAQTQRAALADPEIWIIRNKIDLLQGVEDGATTPDERSELRFINENRFISLSASLGTGVNELLDHLQVRAERVFGAPESLITRERHRLALASARNALARALGERAEEELVAEELRLTSRALGRLTGKVDIEDILDAIFRDFCIGK